MKRIHTKDVADVVVVDVVRLCFFFFFSVFFTLLLIFFPLLSLSLSFLFYVCMLFFLVVLTSEHHNPMTLVRRASRQIERGKEEKANQESKLDCSLLMYEETYISIGVIDVYLPDNHKKKRKDGQCI